MRKRVHQFTICVCFPFLKILFKSKVFFFNGLYSVFHLLQILIKALNYCKKDLTVFGDVLTGIRSEVVLTFLGIYYVHCVGPWDVKTALAWVCA